ncbi:hypothetical protein SRABI96_03722 [Peribacillus sp. Bi96]|nr:hypothetical protein SRABI96_03722 [Peribacillus sp. Bi96]
MASAFVPRDAGMNAILFKKFNKMAFVPRDAGMNAILFKKFNKMAFVPRDAGMNAILFKKFNKIKKPQLLKGIEACSNNEHLSKKGN